MVDSRVGLAFGTFARMQIAPSNDGKRFIVAYLEASAQYDDWLGTGAADNADTKSLDGELKKLGLVPSGRFLVGFDMRLDGVTGQVNFLAHLAIGNNYDEVKQHLPDSGIVDIVVVEIPMTMQQFLVCFKRFNVVMVRKGLGLEGREYPDV